MGRGSFNWGELSVPLRCSLLICATLLRGARLSR